MWMKARVVDDIPNRLVIAIEEHLAKTTPDWLFACGEITCLGVVAIATSNLPLESALKPAWF
jgi:hypothetical protein